MVNHGSSFTLMRNLNILDDIQASVMDINNRLSTAQELVLSHLHNAYERNLTTYNLRSRPRSFEPGQNVFVRNFCQSNAATNFSAKLAPKFVKGQVIRKIGNVSYEIAHCDGKSTAVYHAKDLR